MTISPFTVHQQTLLGPVAAPGTTWAPVTATPFGTGHQLIIAVMTDGTAAPTSVYIKGQMATLLFGLVNGATTGHLSLWSVQPTAAGDNKVTITWAAGPANANARIHEFSPQLKSQGWTQGPSSSGGSNTPTAQAQTPVLNGMKVVGLVDAGAVTGESGTQELWDPWALTAGAMTGRYALALAGTTANSSTYTWTVSSAATFVTGTAASNVALFDAANVAIAPARKPVGATALVKVPVNGRTPLFARPPYAIRRDSPSGNAPNQLVTPRGIDIPVTATDGPVKAITGHVYDVAKNPVQGATVRLFRQWDDFFVASTTTDVNGLYAFARDAMDPWTYYVVAYTTAGGKQVHGTSERDIVPA